LQLYKIAKVFKFIAQILQSITYYCKNILFSQKRISLEYAIELQGIAIISLVFIFHLQFFYSKVSRKNLHQFYPFLKALFMVFSKK